MNENTFDKHASSYNKTLTEQLSFFSKDVNYFAEYKIKLIQSNIYYTPNKILEYGCGTGRNLPFLEKAFPSAELFACDISQQSLHIAKKDYPSVKYFLIEPENTVYSDSFELVFVANVNVGK